MGSIKKTSTEVTNTEHEKKGHEIARVIPFHMNDIHDAWAGKDYSSFPSFMSICLGRLIYLSNTIFIPFATDAALSFEFALKTGIHMSNGALSSGEENAFRNWLQLLSKSLPIQMKRTHDIINLLLENFSVATQSQSDMDRLINRNISVEPKRSWHTCTYGDNKMGYTCGLWQLFHIMSVGVVEYNRHNPPIPTRHASETLRNYIEHFFQCEVCRLNFLDMYDTCAFGGCHRLSDKPASTEREWIELPMWLWETHNDVNVRLMGERLEQNKALKPNLWEVQQARWPSLVACPDCWREDSSWEEERVFEHLHKLFW